MYKIELTEQEALALTQLIDLSVKAGGLQIAEAAVILTKKIQAGKVEETTESKPDEAK